jgi:hypothetical protein
MPLEVGALVVAVFSALLGALWGLRPDVPSRYAFAVGAPLVVSYLAYWLPELGSQTPREEHGGWSLIVISGWYIVGIILWTPPERKETDRCFWR